MGVPPPPRGCIEVGEDDEKENDEEKEKGKGRKKGAKDDGKG